MIVRIAIDGGYVYVEDVTLISEDNDGLELITKDDEESIEYAAEEAEISNIWTNSGVELEERPINYKG